VPPERVQAYFREHRDGRPWGSWEAFAGAWPMSHAGPWLPRFLVLIGDAEREQPPLEADAIRFRERAREHGRSVRIEILPDRRHMAVLTRMTEPSDPTRALILAFVRGAPEGL
jgi:acetyl esterase/lipase